MSEGLKRQRSACKGGLTKIAKFAHEITDGANVSIDDIKTRVSYAKELFERFIKLEASILEVDHEESQMSDFEDEYLAVTSKLNAELRRRQASPRKESTAGHHDETLDHSFQPINIVKYAKVDIPTFSGEPTEFQSFIDLFNAAVHNMETYTPSQKFQLLKRYLSGEAAALLLHLPITDANYLIGMQRLKHRYDRIKPRIYAFIRKFLNIPKISKATASNIRAAHDTADEVMRGLNALGDNADARDWWLIYLLTEKLDDETRSLWAQATVSKDKLTIGDFLKFLDAREEALDAVQVPNKSTVPAVARRVERSAFKSTALTTSAEPVVSKSSSCPLCMKEAHRLIDCAKYNALSVKERQQHIHSNNRCFNCLNAGHRVQYCRSKSRCVICHRRHHKSLHTDEQLIAADSKPETVTSTLTQPKIQSLQVTQRTIAVLPTAIVSVLDNHGIEREFRALLDSGSQASFVTESCSQQLGLKRSNSRINITGIGNTSAVTSRGIVTIRIKPRMPTHTNEMIVNALVIPKVAARLPELMNRDDLKWLSTVQLADPRCYQNRSIDILLGADVFFEILEEGQLKSPNSKLVAQNTKFGWIVGGSAATKVQEIQAHCTLLDIDNTLRRFWEVEDVGDHKQHVMSTDEEACMKHYKENTTRSEDGRFITRLPFKSESINLPSNYRIATSQLDALYRRFRNDPKLHRLYNEFLQEYCTLGHMRKVDGPVDPNAYYMPHHGVLKEKNTTTKLRVVFNASSKVGQNPSLNSMLLTGPTVQSTLWAILLRFRLYRYVFSADIEKMYRQVSVHEMDQKYQLILWRDDDHNLCAYQLTTVTYGTSSAPFVATNTLNELASSFSHAYPQAAKAIQEDVYVDDVLKGADTVEELVTLKRDICAILQNGKFHLRKFVSNHPELHDQSQPNNAKSFDEHKDTTKVLGIQWDPIQDEFRFETHLPVRQHGRDNQTLTYIFTKFSSYKKILRISSYVRRAYSQVKFNTVMLSVDEINQTEAILCREMQRVEFQQEYKELSQHKPIFNKSHLLQYAPFLDDDLVMRVGGRIKNSLAPYQTKHPIILSSKWAISQRIVHQIHNDNCHPGPALLMAMIQERYCIIGARNLVRLTFRRCIGCIKQRPRMEKQIMGNLPLERVNMSAPFACVGIDFAGPFRVHTIRKRGASPETKSYLCVFVCMSTRAIHLELCLQLTTKCFLAALKRFVGRRGLCNTIFCDNGTNFVGAANFLKEMQTFFKTNQTTITNTMMNDRIKFKFNPPGAPHMGGIWESAVRLAKIHLHRTIGEQILTIEEFNTLLVEIESALNTRPLCSSLSPTELVLTPSHFILHRSAQQVPDIIDDKHLSPNDRWDVVRKITLNFWYRWQREYLVNLQARSKWKQPLQNLKENDVVIICEPNLSPGKWMTGRVTDVYPGKDGKVRVIKLKTSNGTTLERPISKVCKLPVNESVDSWPAGCSGPPQALDSSEKGKPNQHKETQIFNKYLSDVSSVNNDELLHDTN